MVQKAVELALQGNGKVLKMVFDRLLPPRRDRPINIDNPVVKKFQDILTALAKIVESVSNGELDPDQASKVAGILRNTKKVHRTRLTEVEERLKEEQCRNSRRG